MRNSLRVSAGLLVACVTLHGAGADEVIAHVGDPEGCFISIRLEQEMIRLQPFGRTPSRYCDVDADMTRSALEAAFQHVAMDHPRRSVRLIFLGRLVDYPWLSHGLTAWAEGRADWNQDIGQPVRIDESENAFVSGLVSLMTSQKLPSSRNRRVADGEGLTFLPELLARYGYRFEHASVEKVLSGPNGWSYWPSDVIEPPILPYDALVHLRIARLP